MSMTASDALWSPAPADLVLLNNAVHVWRVPLDLTASGHMRLLGQVAHARHGLHCSIVQGLPVQGSREHQMLSWTCASASAGVAIPLTHQHTTTAHRLLHLRCTLLVHQSMAAQCSPPATC